MKKILKKFSLVDYVIIILFICAVIFAFIHITSDDSTHTEKTAFDESTINKIPDTFFSNYLDGNIMKVSVNGINASNGEEVDLNGTLKWLDDDGGSKVKILIETDNQTYLLGLYKSVPEADIYINKLSIESNGTKYDNLVEFKIEPMNITSLNNLVSKIPKNTDYEISTKISTDSLDGSKMQEVKNKINSENKRSSVEIINPDINTQLVITRADDDNIKDANSILGNINGITDYITLRIYNCSDNQLNAIKNNYNVVNIRNF